MALALPLVLGLLASTLLGGRLGRLADLRLRGTALCFCAIALQVVAFPFPPLPWRTPDLAARVLWLASYAALTAAAALNTRTPGVAIAAAGMACNVAAVVANGGHMPVLVRAMRAAGRDYVRHQNSAVLADPHLTWLIDRWAAPSWIPGANVFSVGDVTIAVGTFVFAFVATGGASRLGALARERGRNRGLAAAAPPAQR